MFCYLNALVHILYLANTIVNYTIYLLCYTFYRRIENSKQQCSRLGLGYRKGSYIHIEGKEYIQMEKIWIFLCGVYLEH
jgi:hypothetical protein